MPIILHLFENSKSFKFGPSDMKNIQKAGLLSKLSQGMISLTKPSAETMFFTAITTLWFSAISSAIIDNITFVASMIPLITGTAHALLPAGTDVKSII